MQSTVYDTDHFPAYCPLLLQAYYNHHVLALLQTLVTGGTTPQLEEYLAEETSLSGSCNQIMQFAPRNRCKLALLPITEDPDLFDGILVSYIKYQWILLKATTLNQHHVSPLSTSWFQSALLQVQEMGMEESKI